MPESQMFRLGAVVHCTDGDCGQIKSVVISPGGDVLTHLVVEPAGRLGLAKLVPLALIDAAVDAGAGVRLRCSQADYEQLDPAEATYFFPGDEDYPTYRKEPMVSWPIYAPSGAMAMPGAMGMPGMAGD